MPSFKYKYIDILMWGGGVCMNIIQQYSTYGFHSLYFHGYGVWDALHVYGKVYVFIELSLPDWH